MKSLILASLLIFSGIGFSQDDPNFLEMLTEAIANDSTPQPYKPDFNTEFADEEKQLDYRQLRSYLKRKQSLRAEVNGLS